MKDENDLIRSRNGRLNLIHRSCLRLKVLTQPENRPDNHEAWNALFADVRDLAGDVMQGAHEANAYHNSLIGHPPVPPATPTTPNLSGVAEGETR